MADNACIVLTVFPYHEQLQDPVQAAVNWYASTEQPRGTLPSPQLHVTGWLWVGTCMTRAEHVHNMCTTCAQ